nr:2998_t:CDS:2 [Entrophospora candida]
MTPEMETPTDEELFHVQVDGLVAHLSGDHSLCWDEICWLKNNSELELREPHLLNSSNAEYFWQSFAACHSLAVVHHNEGILEMIKKTRLLMLEIPKEQKIMQQNQELISFDFDQDLMPYGKEFQRKVASIEYKPSFAHLIHDFNTISRCLACHSFPKVSSSGLCHACNFYLKHNMHNRFPDKSFQLPNQSSSPDNPPSITPLITEFFRYSGYRECQKESIISFVEGLTVVFSPLKALIDDQVIEVTKMGIPCAGLYTSIGQPASYQKKVFEELSFGFIKILFVTPEKFDKNIGFQKMLYRIYEKFGLHFIIDKAHCVKEYKYFRPSWSNLGKLRDMFPGSPIMMLTATCSREDAGIICNSLNVRPGNLNIIRSSSFSHPEITLDICPKGSREKMIGDITNLISEIQNGKVIIYCATVKSCEETLAQLTSRINPTFNIDIYHGELDGLQKSQTMQKWKNGYIQLMIATNAFGMGINTADIQLVGQAGRDRVESKSVLFFSRNDIRSVYGIVTSGRERFAKDKPSLYDISSDVLRMLEVVDAVVDFLKRKQKDTTRDDIIEKGLSELMIYKTTNNKTIKRQNDALHLLDQLIINGLVLSDIVLRKLPNLSNFHCYIAIIGLKEDSITEAMSKKWQTLLKN